MRGLVLDVWSGLPARGVRPLPCLALLQVCVKRRACLSLEAVLGVSHSEALAAVDKVYDVCFADTAPFATIP